MGTKMAVVILAGVLGGRALDDRSSLEFPLWTLVLSMLGVALAIYFVIKDTSQ